MMSDDADLVNRALAQWAAVRASRAAMREAQAAGWPVVVVNDPLLLLDDDHLRARGVWVTAKHPVAGALTYPGAPWRVDGGGWALLRAAPTLGQDTDAVLVEVLATPLMITARTRTGRRLRRVHARGGPPGSHWMHHNGTQIIDMQDEALAFAETYALAFYRPPEADGKTGAQEIFLRVRYLDRVEKRDGQWKIAHRRVVYSPCHILPIAQEFPLVGDIIHEDSYPTDPAYSW